jgi:hypothetical protein
MLLLLLLLLLLHVVGAELFANAENGTSAAFSWHITEASCMRLKCIAELRRAFSRVRYLGRREDAW